jgi:cholesterol transport system auxiliary component
MFRAAVLLVLISGLGGCSLPFNLKPSATANYVLTDEADLSCSGIKVGGQLLVREMTGSGYAESHRIVFSRKPNERGSYQFAFWTETPSKQLTDLLIRKLQECEVFAVVARAGSGAVGDMQLNSELVDFYHDLSQGKGVVKVMVRAELIELKTRRVISGTQFTRTEPVLTENVEGAVTAFNRAASQVRGELMSWLGESAAGVMRR